MFNAASTWATTPPDPFWHACVENENVLKHQLIFLLSGFHCTCNLTEQVTMPK